MIIGPPRSGTSILGRVIGQHPDIYNWIEPYYIWDYHFREHPHDERMREDASPKVTNRIRRSFEQCRRTLGVDHLIDKSPRNSLKIPFIKEVFPEARYIFILRDGRDTVLSIKKQWESKGKVFSGSFTPANMRGKYVVFKKWLTRKPLWSHRWQSFCFETGLPKHLSRRKFLNRVRWEGRFGWGPRFKGWQELIDRVSLLEYCAYQWAACATRVAEGLPLIPDKRKLIVRYEDFIKAPKNCLEDIFSFLGINVPLYYLEKTPEIWADNANKWKKEMSAEELMAIKPIMQNAMNQLGYPF